MSLDDPAVMAGISVDGQPFFDDPSQAHNQHRSADPEGDHDGLLTTDIGPDIDTPMPLRRDAGRIHIPAISGRPATATGAASSNSGGSGKMFGIGNLPTPSKDVDARELKEFWKQYLRTPLTSQDAGPEGSSVGPGNKMSSPSSHRRQRVSSLPAVKTPMMERGDLFTHLGYPTQHQDQRRGEKGAGVQQGPMSSLRTTLHVKEDLSSYEAAVLARKAPMLNLQLKRPGRASVPFPAPNQQGRNDLRNAKESVEFGSRPPSSAGHTQLSSFSFANAFGEQANGSISVSSSGSLSFKEESDSPSLASSRATSVDNCAQSESESRPSFKRLASHTLGPESSKRTFFGYGDEIVERDNMVGWTTDPHAIGRMYSGGGVVCQGIIHQPDRGAASIAERRRRSTASSIDALKFSHGRRE